MTRPQRVGSGDDSAKTLKIGEAARILKTTPRTLRFYEELGLLAPARSVGKTRCYTASDLSRLHAALNLTELGIGLRAVIALADARPRSRTGGAASRKVDRLLTEMRRDIEAKKSQCETILHQINAAEALVRQCFGCQKPPRHDRCRACPVARHVDDVPLLRLVWDQNGPDVRP